jgi:hypothetical protein
MQLVFGKYLFATKDGVSKYNRLGQIRLSSAMTECSAVDHIGLQGAKGGG